MLQELLSKPKFVVPRKSANEWGHFFVETAALILANTGGTTGKAVESAIRSAASLAESLIEISHQK